jgi:hypothetical protein
MVITEPLDLSRPLGKASGRHRVLSEFPCPDFTAVAAAVSSKARATADIKVRIIVSSPKARSIAPIAACFVMIPNPLVLQEG